MGTGEEGMVGWWRWKGWGGVVLDEEGGLFMYECTLLGDGWQAWHGRAGRVGQVGQGR